MGMRAEGVKGKDSVAIYVPGLGRGRAWESNVVWGKVMFYDAGFRTLCARLSLKEGCELHLGRCRSMSTM